jgi:hypothetical protein
MKNTSASNLDLARSAMKSLLPPSATEYASERHVIFTISLRQIMKNTSASNLDLVRSAVKNLLHNPVCYRM